MIRVFTLSTCQENASEHWLAAIGVALWLQAQQTQTTIVLSMRFCETVRWKRRIQ